MLVFTTESAVDRATGKVLSGTAGEYLRDTVNQYNLIGEKVIYLQCPKTLPLLESLAVGHNKILISGGPAAGQLGFPEYLYTYHVRKAKLIVVPSVSEARYLYSDDSTNDEDEDDDKGGNNKDSAPTSRLNYSYWIQEGVRKLLGPNLSSAQPTNIQSFSPADLKNFISSSGYLVIDIETQWPIRSHYPKEVIVVGIGRDTDNTVMQIVLYDFSGKCQHSTATMVEFHRILSEAFRTKLLVLHNAMFDLTVLCMFLGLPVPSQVHCTMLMHHRIAPEVEKDLGHCIGQYTDLPYHKDEIHTGDFQKYLLYNARDIIGTMEIYREMLKIVNITQGLVSACQTSWSAIPVYLENSLRGLEVDPVGLRNAQESLGNTIHQFEDVINILAGFELNVGSSKQLLEYFDCFGYKISAKTKEGSRSVGKKSLNVLAVTTHNPIIPLIIQLKKLKKSSSMLVFEQINYT